MTDYSDLEDLAPSDDNSSDHDAAILADGHRASDNGNADRLVAAANGHIRYVHAWKKWIVYRDGVWCIDHGDALVTEVAKLVPRQMFRLAAERSGHDRDDLWKWAKRSDNIAAIRAMIHLARGMPGAIVDHNQLDQHPWLLNVRNGTIDLRTSELLPPDPEHLLTIQAPISFDTDAKPPLWDKCLKTWQPDEAMRSYLQRAIGSAATGHPVEHLFVNVGDGANGKGRFFGAIHRALGDYVTVPDQSLFITTTHREHPTVKADLYGRRMLLVPETDHDARLNEAQVKELTGGDPISARRMQEDPWQFQPSWTAFLHTNHHPIVRGTDDGVWRRIRLIPWTVTIPPAKRDTRLAAKLAHEAPGILNWIIAGAKAFHEHGFDEPDTVTEATDAYREDQDNVGRFLAECCIVGDGRYAYASDLRHRYEEWCNDVGEQPLQPQAVGLELRRRGIQKASSGRHRWLHIGLLETKSGKENPP